MKQALQVALVIWAISAVLLVFATACGVGNMQLLPDPTVWRVAWCYQATALAVIMAVGLIGWFW
jgi:hypothetical protein